MHISFAPQRRDDSLVVLKAGDVLTINGEAFDFSGLPDGATIPAGGVPCEWIVGRVERIEGEIHLTLILPYGPMPEIWQTHPDAVVVVDDGQIDIPTDTVIERRINAAAGGINVVTTTRRWHYPDAVETMFIPDPPTPETNEEEADHVDA